MYSCGRTDHRLEITCLVTLHPLPPICGLEGGGGQECNHIRYNKLKKDRSSYYILSIAIINVMAAARVNIRYLPDIMNAYI